jgi:hypothetical protein
MSGLCPGMVWGCGGTERERSDRAVPPYQGLVPSSTVRENTSGRA